MRTGTNSRPTARTIQVITEQAASSAMRQEPLQPPSQAEAEPLAYTDPARAPGLPGQ